MNEKTEKLLNLIKNSNRIVFFGGAGVSTESGIKDFRSVDGLYNESYDYPPEEILSHSFFMNHTSLFFKFYRDKLNTNGFSYNVTHKVLSELEELGKLSSVITQNIDGFHTMAGSKKVLELHGSIKRNYCMNCGKFYDDNFVFSSKDVPICSCGGIIKPDVVLYEEGLDYNVVEEAIDEISNADLLLVCGTSLNVYPAASFLNHYNGDNLVLINRDPTSWDSKANIVIHDSLGKVFSVIEEKIKEGYFSK